MQTARRGSRALLALLLLIATLQPLSAQAAGESPTAVGHYTGTLVFTATKTRSSQYTVANEKVTLTLPMDLTLTRKQDYRDEANAVVRAAWVLESNVHNTPDVPPPPGPNEYGYNYNCSATSLTFSGSFDLKVTAWRINAEDSKPDKIRLSADQGYTPPDFKFTAPRLPGKPCGLYNHPGTFVWDVLRKCTYDEGCLVSSEGETKSLSGTGYDGEGYTGTVTLQPDQQCPVTRRSNPPWQDPDSKRLEDEQAVIWDKGARSKDLIAARDKFLERVRARGWQAAPAESAYRSEEYQNHFIEIVDKLAQIAEIEKAKDPRQIFACTARKFELTAEKKKHGLGQDVAKPASASAHVQGAAFDMKVMNEQGVALNGMYYDGTAIPRDPALAELAGPELIMPLPETDSVHFELPPPCPVPLPKPLSNLDKARSRTGQVLWQTAFQDPDSQRLEKGEVIWDKGARIRELQPAKDALLSRLPKTWRYRITAAYMTAEYRQHLLDVSGALKKMLDLTARSDIKGCMWYRDQLEQHWVADQPKEVPGGDTVGAQHVAGAAFTIAVWNESGHPVTGKALRDLAGPALVVATPDDANIRLELPPLQAATPPQPEQPPAPQVPPPAAARPVKVTDMFVKVRGALTDAEVVILNGRSLLPIRLVATLLGATVEWSAELAQATIRKADKTVRLQPGAMTAEVTAGGQTSAVPLEVPVTVVDDRIRVPLKFVGNVLDVKVEWDGVTRTILIDD